MNIRAFLRSVLLDPEIISLTGDGTVHFLHAVAPVIPYIEYAIYDENGALYAEGIETATDYYIQADIFSKGDYTVLEDAIKIKMANAGFVRSSGADLYEPEPIDLYHKAMRFTFTTNTI